MELTDGRDHTAHAYSTDIIFPQKIGGKLVYVKQVHVPETLKSGEYKVKICGLLKDGRKLCQKSDAFHIEGDQMECKHNNLHAANQSKCLDFRVVGPMWKFRGTHRSGISWVCAAVKRMQVLKIDAVYLIRVRVFTGLTLNFKFTILWCCFFQTGSYLKDLKL